MIQAFDVSIGLFTRGLENLKVLLAKAEAHAATVELNPSELLGAKLAGDMYNLTVQAHWACEGAKLAVNRLLGVEARPATEEAKSFGELHERIDATITHLRAVDPQALEASLGRTIELPYGSRIKSFSADRFLTEFAIPNFYFHLVTAYGILRHHGVPLHKSDFMGE
jgi:uncharacterized protein